MYKILLFLHFRTLNPQDFILTCCWQRGSVWTISWIWNNENSQKTLSFDSCNKLHLHYVYLCFYAYVSASLFPICLHGEGSVYDTKPQPATRGQLKCLASKLDLCGTLRFGTLCWWQNSRNANCTHKKKKKYTLPSWIHHHQHTKITLHGQCLILFTSSTCLNFPCCSSHHPPQLLKGGVHAQQKQWPACLPYPCSQSLLPSGMKSYHSAQMAGLGQIHLQGKRAGRFQHR